MRLMQTRKKPRKTITIPGRYFTGLGTPKDVTIADLSPGGCKFEADERGLVPGARIQLYVAKTGPHHAVVKWRSDGEVGVTFASPLSDEQFASFESSHVPDSALDIGEAAFDDMPASLPHRFC